MDHDKTRAAELMELALKTHIERNTAYGSAYKRHGAVVMALFPDGVRLESSADHGRFAIISLILSKLVRYSSNFSQPHQDSIHDIIVYSAMLEELDEEVNRNRASAALFAGGVEKLSKAIGKSLEGKSTECACRRPIRHGSRADKDCQQCHGTGYVVVKVWSEKDREGEE